MKIKLYGIDLETLDLISGCMFNVWSNSLDNPQANKYIKIYNHLSDAQQKGLSENDICFLNDWKEKFIKVATFNGYKYKIIEEYNSLNAYAEARERHIKTLMKDYAYLGLSNEKTIEKIKNDLER